MDARVPRTTCRIDGRAERAGATRPGERSRRQCDPSRARTARSYPTSSSSRSQPGRRKPAPDSAHADAPWLSPPVTRQPRQTSHATNSIGKRVNVLGGAGRSCDNLRPWRPDALAGAKGLVDGEPAVVADALRPATTAVTSSRSGRRSGHTRPGPGRDGGCCGRCRRPKPGAVLEVGVEQVGGQAIDRGLPEIATDKQVGWLVGDAEVRGARPRHHRQGIVDSLEGRREVHLVAEPDPAFAGLVGGPLSVRHVVVAVHHHADQVDCRAVRPGRDTASRCGAAAVASGVLAASAMSPVTIDAASPRRSSRPRTAATRSGGE